MSGVQGDEAALRTVSSIGKKRAQQIIEYRTEYYLTHNAALKVFEKVSLFLSLCLCVCVCMEVLILSPIPIARCDSTRITGITLTTRMTLGGRLAWSWHQGKCDQTDLTSKHCYFSRSLVRRRFGVDSNRRCQVMHLN